MHTMEPYKVLFVCWGNICRSPAAECVFQHKINEKKLDKTISCDSAGTMGMHAGSPPDSRMRQAAAKRSIAFFGKSRKIRSSDFSDFDLILVMDQQNLFDVEAQMPSGKIHAEVKLFGELLDMQNPPEVSDPYYGGAQGFEIVLDMVDAGCDKLIKELTKP